MGDDFDIRECHDAVLKNGAAPLNLLELQVNQYITEKKALAFLFQLEKATFELVVINKQIMDLTKEFEERWLQK